MGLADRQYGWQPERTSRVFHRLAFWSVNTWIIAINVVVFFLSAFLVRPGSPLLLGINGPANAVQLEQFYRPDGSVATPREITTAGTKLVRPLIDPTTKEPVGGAVYVVQAPLQAWGHFSTATILGAQVWRFITFQFLHANIWHIFFNMFGLYMFGPTVERYLGGQRYLAFYLVTGIFGGLMYLLLNVLGIAAYQMGFPAIPGLLFHTTTTPLIGASAGVFGVIVACAKIEPDTLVQLLFPPVALRMKIFAYGFVAFAMINLFIGAQNAGGEAAHIGGAIAGYFFIRNSHLLRDFFDVFTDSRRPANRRGPSGSWNWLKRQSDDTAEVDRILDKVRASGVASLSESERRVLARDTERLRGPNS
ncbi:MAG: rhomboid family intramembrane serine protease [Planctomycetes bacterium]|nr:rhomboid family intramembrane serine protease [Planctomycetota bacterium]